MIQIIWAWILEICGRYNAESKKTLDSWKFLEHRGKEEKKLMSKVRKSCRPFSFGEKGIFVIKRMTVLKFLRGIVKGTFRALLTLGRGR